MQTLFSTSLRRAMPGLALAAGLLGLAAPASAQVARYTFAQSTRAYVPLTAGTVLATALANASPGPLALSGAVYALPAGAIPFPFSFNGTAYTTAYVASGGYLTFGALAPVPRFTTKPGSYRVYDIDHPLSEPDGTGYDGVIAPLAGDVLGNVAPNNLGDIRYQTLGVAPNRVFVVQWAHMRVYATTSDLNFQVQLLEAGNAVELAYGPNQAGLNVSGQTMLTQVGLRGSTPNDFNNRTGTWAASTAGTANTDGLTVGPGSVPANGLVYGFTPGATQPCPQPFSLYAAPAGTRAVLHWRAAAPSAGPYTVVYGLAGFNPAVPAQVLGTQTATGTSATITGLTPTTNYDFYVTQQCSGSAGASLASNPPGRFRTTVLNDEAVDAVAVPVNATCQPVSATLAGSTRSVGNGYNPLQNCNGNAGSAEDADVWFTVTTAASGPASTAMQITPGGSTAVEVRVLSSANGAAGPFTQLYCQANSSNSGLFAPFTLAGLTPNTTYFLLITNAIELNPKGPFTLCATVPPACGDPTGIASYIVNSTATTAQFSFMAGSGAINYTITLTPPGGPTQTVTPPPTSSPITLTGLTPATVYAATLQANCSGGGLSAVVPFSAYTRPINDAITAAIALPITAACQPVAGSTQNATGTVPTIRPPAGCGDVTPYDVWYTFTTSATGLASQAVRIVATGRGAGQIRVFQGTPGSTTQVNCTASATGPLLLDLTNLTPSTSYYILVGNYTRPAVQGPFTICVTEPPTCGTPQGANVSNITATSAQLLFAPGVPPATAGYTVTLTAQGQAPTTLTNPGTNGLIPLTGLTSGTFYTVALQANCGTGGLSLPATLSFLTLGTPANDLCANAQVVHCGDGPVLGVVTGATATGQPGAACGGSPPLGAGVWYRLAGTGQTVTLSFCSGYADDPDLQLLVYSGSCGNLTCVGSNDNSTSCGYVRLPALTFPTVAGVDYYALVVDTGRPIVGPPSSGIFSLYVRCTASPTCPPPTALTVAPLTTTSARATWTPAPGATSYQVLWQALGSGAAPTLTTVNAPPATNAQLLPNMQYQVTVTAVCPSPNGRSVDVSATFSTVLGTAAARSLNGLAVYPNPSNTGSLTLRLDTPAAGQATLYNALGQPVLTQPLAAGAEATLPVRGLAAGLYTLRVQTGGAVLTRKVVLE